MGLQGTLDTMPVVELFDWLGRKTRTGILTFKRSNVAKTLTIDSGRVINAASTDAREYFGQFLINFGLVTEDQLQKAFETQQETKILIGKILVMTGLVDEETINRMLELKIRETTLDIFLWDQGSFQFHDGVLPDEPSIVPAAVEIKELFSEGYNRRRQHVEIRQMIPHNSCRFICHEDAIPADIDPRSADSIMIQLAREGRETQDIILRFHSLDFPILKNLYDLVRRGWISIDSGQQEEPVSDEIPEPEVVVPAKGELQTGPDAYLMTAQEKMQVRDYDGSIAILKRGLVDHPYDPDLCDALELAEKGLAEALRVDMLSDKRIPFLQRDDILQISGKWTPAQRYILSRIDGRRNLRSIIMVSPLKEVEALKTFRSLIEAGYVGLR